MIKINIEKNEDGANILPVIPADAVFSEVANGEITIYFAEDQESIDLNQIGECKKYAIGEVRKQCGNEILKGFTSSVSGAPKVYRNKIEDQMNITSMAASNRGGKVSDGSLVKEQLLATEIKTLSEDMVISREAIIAEKESRYIQIQSATTNEEIEAIINSSWVL